MPKSPLSAKFPLERNAPDISALAATLLARAQKATVPVLLVRGEEDRDGQAG